MRILITGSRDWDDEQRVLDALYEQWCMADSPSELTLVSGNCLTGADEIAERVIRSAGMGWEPELHPADWGKHGRKAGPIRNAHMVSLGADICLAFIGDCTSPHCNIPGKHHSHGATGCADLAEKAGIPTRRFFA